MASKVETTKSAPTFFEQQSALFNKGFSFSGYERDLFSLNKGNGTFLELSGASGIDSITDGRGTAFADFDSDGDTDVFLRAMHERAHLLFRNEIGSDAPSFRVSLEGTKSGRDAFGAIVRAKVSAGILTQVKAGGSGFLSQSDPRLLFGLGKDQKAEWLEVSWPSGVKQRFPGPKAGASWRIVEGDANPRPVAEKRFSLPSPESSADSAWRALKLHRGDLLPKLALTTPAGGSAAALPTGSLMIVNFWATWCAPCAKEMPELERLAKASGGKLKVIGISVDDDSTRSRIGEHVKRAGATYPVACISRAELQKIFNGDVPVPTSLIVDEKGRVIEVLTGWTKETKDRLGEIATGSLSAP